MKLVLVEWQDSRQASRAWQWTDEAGQPEPVRCLTVGWLLKETVDALLVAQSLGDVTRGRMQFSGGTEIARRQIVHLTTLAPPFFAESVYNRMI